MNSSSVDENWNIFHPNIRKVEISDSRNSFFSRNGKLILYPTGKNIDSKETGLCTGNVKIVENNIFNKSSTARTAFDIYGKCSCGNKFAMFYTYISDAARCLASYSNAGKNIIGKSTVCDLNILSCFQQGIGLHSPARFYSDTIISGCNITTINKYVFTGININSIPVATTVSDCQVLNCDIFTVGGMNPPHQMIIGRKTLKQNISATHRFNKCRMA